MNLLEALAALNGQASTRCPRCNRTAWEAGEAHGLRWFACGAGHRFTIGRHVRQKVLGAR